MRKPAQLPLEQLAPYLVEVERPYVPRQGAPVHLPLYDGKRPIVWEELFGRGGSVEIEVGFGKGLFLSSRSAAHPDRCFLGIEKERRYTLAAATRLCRAGVANVKLVCADARWFLREWVSSSSTAAVHVYFPDPWWKKRHHKHRLFHVDFAEQVVRILAPGGRLHFATDVEAYAEETLRLLRSLPLLAEEPPVPEAAPSHDMDYLTHFERKFRQRGKPIFRAVFMKRWLS